MTYYLRIASITLTNFKSWYGTHTIQFAEYGLACIVGANGSGKSNIIDALLFVFGWRAKYLRQDRLVDLIHYSHEHPDFARVGISFLTANGIFEISRTIRQNGQSVYEIGDYRVTLEQIYQTLLSNGLDVAHNRFLILYGEVESIALMKPCGEDVLGQMVQAEGANLLKFQQLCESNAIAFSPVSIYQQIEKLSASPAISPAVRYQLGYIQGTALYYYPDAGLLEFIESVVGTQRYLPQLAQHLAVCDFLNEEKSQMRVKLSATVYHRDAMNEIKNEARDKIIRTGTYIREEMQMYMNMASTGRIGIYESNLRLHDTQKTIQECQNQSYEADQSIASLNTRLTGERYYLNDASALVISAKAEVKANDVVLGCLAEKKSGFMELLANAKTEEQRLRGDFVVLQQEHDTYAEQSMLLNSYLERVEELLGKAQNELSVLSSEYTYQDQRQSILRNEITLIEKTIQPIQTDKTRLYAQHTSFTRQVAYKLQVFVESAYQTVYALFGVCEGQSYKNSRLNQLNNKIVQLKTEISCVDETKLLSYYYEIQNSEYEYKQRLQELNLVVRENEQQKREFETSDRLLNALIRAQEDGKLHGIHGRLGYLGYVDPGFNLAAIAAFGAQLDHIVCDNMDCIQIALSFIRQHDLGIASFIDLEQVSRRFYQHYRRPLPQDDLIASLGGRVFLELVRTQEAFYPAFWHVMQETVLCDDVKQAMYLSKGRDGQRMRVVTLGGELFERSGSLTGGGASNLYSRYKGFRQGVYSGDIGPVKRDIHNIEANLAQITSQMQQIQQYLEKYQSVQEYITLCYQNIQGLQFEIQSYKSKLLQQAQAVFKINDNITFKYYSAQINPMIIQELQHLSELLYYNQTGWEVEKYIQATPSIIELAYYYQQQKMSTPEKFYDYIKAHDNIFLLESEESLLANIVQFYHPINEMFNISYINYISQQLHDVEQQEHVLRCDLEAKQAYLDSLGTVRRFKQLKKELADLYQRKTSIMDYMTQLNIREAQYQYKHTSIEQAIMDVEYRLNATEMQLLQLDGEVYNAQARHAELVRVLADMEANQYRCNAVVAQSEQEMQSLEKRQKMLGENLRGLTSQLKYIQMQIEAFQRQILAAETQMVLATDALGCLNGELEKIQEKIAYQPPLFSTHHNAYELADYDTYVVATYAESRKHCALPTLTQLKTSLGQEFSVLLEFYNRVQQLEQRQADFYALAQLSDEYLRLLEELRQRRQTTFVEAFTDINAKLRQIYRIFSMGGDALLEFQNHFDPFEGVIFSVMPPKKAWRQIQNLSGGEKTLSSLALIFALHQYRQNTIYVVDEIDAALDFRNVSLVANYLREQSQYCYFVIVSLRNNTFEAADRLIGVYKVANCSRVAILDVKQ